LKPAISQILVASQTCCIVIERVAATSGWCVTEKITHMG
jgi:hypothetical protein